MPPFEWYDGVRVLTIILCVFALGRLTLRIIKNQDKHSEYLNEFTRVLFAAIGFIAVNSFERIMDDNGVHVGFFIGFVVALYACTMTFHNPYESYQNHERNRHD